MFRRDFIRLLGLAPLGMLAPSVFGATPRGLLGALAQPTEFAAGNWNRFLVLVELKGGNDGLNMVVPFTDPQYYTARPRLAIDRNQVVQLTPQLGFNPALQPLLPLWQANEIALALGVGYPEPNRSHFRSIEIWETASDSNEVVSDGWVAQVLSPTNAQRKLMADGIILGGGAEMGPLAGNLHTITLADPKRFIAEARRVKDPVGTGANPALAHIMQVQDEIKQSERTMAERLATPPQFKTAFPGSSLGRQLQTAAQLLAARVPVAVLKVTLGSFDTHSNQRNGQDRLLKELADALVAFRGALVETNLWNQTLVMTYSEFGRRVAQNGSNGTDHGTAAPHMLLGGSVKGGLYGQQPSLTQLVNGDLVHKLDYRSLYSTVATNWWGLPLTTANGHHYAPLGCIKA